MSRNLEDRESLDLDEDVEVEGNEEETDADEQENRDQRAEDDESEDSVEEGDEETSRLIASTNKLLADVGIVAKKIRSQEELIRVAPSMVVAVFESLYHNRIDGIIRNPTTRKHYEKNAQLMIDSLSDQINIDLTHISGKSIVEGDLQALSNLVYIFKRIVTLTTANESLSTIDSSDEDNDGEKRHRNTADSISTKDSLLDAMDGAFPSMLTPKKSYLEPDTSHFHHAQQSPPQRSLQQSHSQQLSPSQQPQRRRSSSASSPQQSSSLFDSYVQQSLRKVDQQLDFELRQHRASRRRKTLQFVKQSQSMQKNARLRAKSLQIAQKKSLDDLVSQDRAHQLQKMNEEVVLLREVYASLFREEIKLKIDEEKLLRQRQEHAKDYVAGHVENMEKLFKERLQMLHEQEKNLLSNNSPANDELLENVISHVSDQQRSLFEKERAFVQQQRDRLLLWRRESYQDLVSLLGAEKWSEKLRSYSAEQPLTANRNQNTSHISASLEQRLADTVAQLAARAPGSPTAATHPALLASPNRRYQTHPLLGPPRGSVPASVFGIRKTKKRSKQQTGNIRQTIERTPKNHLRKRSEAETAWQEQERRVLRALGYREQLQAHIAQQQTRDNRGERYWEQSSAPAYSQR